MPPTNDFLPFATGGGANVESQGSYAADGQLPIGNQPGIGRSAFVNKTLRQAAWIASQVADFLATRTGNNVLDDANASTIQATMVAAWPAVIPPPTNSFAQAYATGASWSTTSPTFVDLTPSGTSVLTVRQSSGIALTTAAANLPGIIFTPASASAVYLITASVSTQITGAVNGGGGLQLTDGTTVIVQGSDVDQLSGGAQFTPYSMTGIFVPGTASPVTVKIQGYATSGETMLLTTASLGNAIEWTVLRIK